MLTPLVYTNTMTLTIEAFRKWGKQGGKKRAGNLTAKQRKKIAKRAARARWSKKSRKGGIKK
jgi:hypothetical protein